MACRQGRFDLMSAMPPPCVSSRNTGGESAAVASRSDDVATLDDGLYTESLHHVQMMVSNAYHDQVVANVFRRLFRMTIIRTPEQAAEDVRRWYLRTERR
jgi:hypothetical protein